MAAEGGHSYLLEELLLT
ncbi:hypothetical protein [Wolbachia endosymbiont of Encarsia formosa]